MSLRLKNSRGLTLIEMVIAVVLSSLVMLAVASVFITAMRFFYAFYIENSQVAPLYATEEVTRTISRANRVIVSSEKLQLNLRVDNNGVVTPVDYSDDAWVLFGLVRDDAAVALYRLRAREVAVDSSNLDAVPFDSTVDTNDPEIQPGLIFQDTPALSRFELSADGITVNITFVVNYGSPPVVRTITTSAAARNMAIS
jgi:prepilin-type N-terminal cleavage/methylation domain-containing protein